MTPEINQIIKDGIAELNKYSVRYEQERKAIIRLKLTLAIIEDILKS